ncbi:MAG: hypothetical protein NVSMB9_18760 [Isosphaeraceae bacterium]
MLKPKVQIQKENGILVAEFWDCLRLDSNAVQDLRTKYEDHLRDGGRPDLLVNMLGVCFAGSASLGHFVAMHRLARSKNGRLIFCNVDPTVLEVFRVSKLQPLFVFVSDREAALAYVANVAGGKAADPGTPTPDGLNPPARNLNGEGLVRSSRRRKLS